MNRRRFLSGICGAVAALMGWPKKAEPQVSSQLWIGPDLLPWECPEVIEDLLVGSDDKLYIFGSKSIWVQDDPGSQPRQVL